MPGGSVNGKPFKEDVDAYSRTGIPCGNPKRYQSHSVIRMAPGSRPPKRQCLEAPEDEIETEGDRQLKNLVKKQLRTQVTLKEQLNERRTFTQPTVFKPLTAEVTGELSLGQYQSVADHDTRINTLRQYGLTDEEIKLKLKHDKDWDKKDSDSMCISADIQSKFGLQSVSKYGTDPSTVQDRLQQIEEKIRKKDGEMEKPDAFSGVKVLTRHDMDLEMALTHGRDKSKVSQLLLTSQHNYTQSSDYHPDHPMNHIKTMLEGITRGKRKKKKNAKKGSGLVRDNRGTDEDESCVDQVESDLPEGPVCGPKTKTKTVREAQNITWLEDGSFTAIVDDVEPVSKDTITSNRLSLEEIKSIPRFAQYNPGEPCKILYVKNLPHQLTETQLAALFISFQDQNNQKIVFKLLHGRMKGQAFVTFNEISTATSAMELVNGYKLRDKPVIIQYGKKKDTDR